MFDGNYLQRFKPEVGSVCVGDRLRILMSKQQATKHLVLLAWQQELFPKVCGCGPRWLVAVCALMAQEHQTTATAYAGLN